MTTYLEQIRQRIWQRYREEVSPEPADLKTVAAWAISKGLWAPRPIDLNTSLANDLADALRDETRTDKSGRRYRANIPVRHSTKGGAPLFVWADIDDAPRTHVEKNVQQERRQIASHCYALAMKVDHYNDAHPGEDQIPLVLDFSDDVEEMKIADNPDDEADAA